MHIFNRFAFWGYCSYLGLLSGVILALFLKATAFGTNFLWQTLPQWLDNPGWYPLIVGALGGLAIGLFRKKHGDYPQTFFDIIVTIKTAGSYPYKKTAIIFIATLLPLILGSSVGMVAGIIGIVCALFFWGKDRLLLVQNRLFPMAYSSPSKEATTTQTLPRTTKIGACLIAAISALVILLLVRHFFGKYSAGFPRFAAIHPDTLDLLLMLFYLICGIGLGFFFKKNDDWCASLSVKLPPVLSEMIAGLMVGLAIAYLPFIPFSGQNQMLTLLADYKNYAPLAMIGVAFLKIILTNFCIHFGLKGGFFFPLVLAAVCLGFGISFALFPANIAHATFAAAILSAAALSVCLSKPLFITALLLLCFPLELSIWIFLASLLVSMIMKGLHHEKKA